MMKNIRRSESGATLMELIIYISLMVVLTVVIFGTFLAAFNSSTASESQSSVASNGQNISQQMANDIHSAVRVYVKRSSGNTFITTQQTANNYKSWAFTNNQIYVIRQTTLTAAQNTSSKKTLIFEGKTVPLNSYISSDGTYKYGSYISYGFTVNSGKFSSTLRNIVKIGILKSSGTSMLPDENELTTMDAPTVTVTSGTVVRGFPLQVKAATTTANVCPANNTVNIRFYQDSKLLNTVKATTSGSTVYATTIVHGYQNTIKNQYSASVYCSSSDNESESKKGNAPDTTPLDIVPTVANTNVNADLTSTGSSTAQTLSNPRVSSSLVASVKTTGYLTNTTKYTTASGTQTQVSWRSVPGAGSYIVNGTASDGKTYTQTVSSNVLSATFNNLAGENIKYTVTAKASLDNSTLSGNSVSLNTAPNAPSITKVNVNSSSNTFSTSSNAPATQVSYTKGNNALGTYLWKNTSQSVSSAYSADPTCSKSGLISTLSGSNTVSDTDKWGSTTCYSAQSFNPAGYSEKTVNSTDANLPPQYASTPYATSRGFNSWHRWYFSDYKQTGWWSWNGTYAGSLQQNGGSNGNSGWCDTSSCNGKSDVTIKFDTTTNRADVGSYKIYRECNVVQGSGHTYTYNTSCGYSTESKSSNSLYIGWVSPGTVDYYWTIAYANNGRYRTSTGSVDSLPNYNVGTAQTTSAPLNSWTTSNGYGFSYQPPTGAADVYYNHQDNNVLESDFGGGSAPVDGQADSSWASNMVYWHTGANGYYWYGWVNHEKATTSTGYSNSSGVNPATYIDKDPKGAFASYNTGNWTIYVEHDTWYLGMNSVYFIGADGNDVSSNPQHYTSFFHLQVSHQ